MTTRVPGSTNAVAIVPISDWAPWAGITICDGTPSQPVAEVGECPLRVERRAVELRRGGVQRLLRRPEQILVPVQRLELGQPVALLQLVARLARVVALEAAQRRPGQAIPVGHAPASARSAGSSARTHQSTASAPVISSGAWL